MPHSIDQMPEPRLEPTHPTEVTDAEISQAIAEDLRFTFSTEGRSKFIGRGVFELRLRGERVAYDDELRNLVSFALQYPYDKDMLNEMRRVAGVIQARIENVLNGRGAGK